MRKICSGLGLIVVMYILFFIGRYCGNSFSCGLGGMAGVYIRKILEFLHSVL